MISDIGVFCTRMTVLTGLMSVQCSIVCFDIKIGFYGSKDFEIQVAISSFRALGEDSQIPLCRLGNEKKEKKVDPYCTCAVIFGHNNTTL